MVTSVIVQKCKIGSALEINFTIYYPNRLKGKNHKLFQQIKKSLTIFNILSNKKN